MAITQNHIINIQPGVSAPLVIHCSQGDTGSVINLTVVNGDEVFDCSSYVCSVHGVRSDGANWGPYEVTVSGSTVSFSLRQEMTAIAGPCLAEITIGTVGTANFAILVENATFSLGVTYTEDVSLYQSILSYNMGAVQDIKAEATAGLNKAIDQMNANTNAINAKYDAAIDQMNTMTNEAIDQMNTKANDLQNQITKQQNDYEKTINTKINDNVSTATANWLLNNITNPTSPTIDNFLTVNGSAANSESAGAISSAEELFIDVTKAYHGYYDINKTNNLVQLNTNDSYYVYPPIFLTRGTYIITVADKNFSFISNSDGVTKFTLAEAVGKHEFTIDKNSVLYVSFYNEDLLNKFNLYSKNQLTKEQINDKFYKLNSFDVNTLVENKHYDKLNNVLSTNDVTGNKYFILDKFYLPIGHYTTYLFDSNFTIFYDGKNYVSLKDIGTEITSGQWILNTDISYEVFPTLYSTKGADYVKKYASFKKINEVSYDPIPNVPLDSYVLNKYHIFIAGTNTYPTISSACEKAKNGDTVIVLPGIYNEAVSCWGKEVHIIGINKKSCILKNSTGDYDTPPIEMNIGSLSNMTIIADYKNYTGTDNDATQYCLHCESGHGYTNNGLLIVDNCNFYNAKHCCIGAGLYENLTLRFQNCFMETGHTNQGDMERGCFYYHSNSNDNVKGQRIELIDCIIRSGSDKAIYCGHTNERQNIECITLIDNCTFYAKNGEINSNSLVIGKFDSVFTLDKGSANNNIPMLNASA